MNMERKETAKSEKVIPKIIPSLRRKENNKKTEVKLSLNNNGLIYFQRVI